MKPKTKARKPLKLRKGYIRKQSLRYRARLERELWALLAINIKDRDNWTCITCGKIIRGSAMNCGHYHPKGLYTRVKFNPKNLAAQCAGCNCWNYGKLSVYAEKLIEKYGEGIIKELADAKKNDPILTDKQIEELIKVLKDQPNLYEIRYFEFMKKGSII